MTPLAALPLQLVADMEALPRLRDERDRLVTHLRTGCQRSLRGLMRRRRLELVTRDILAREGRLVALGIDPAAYSAAVPRPYTETEH